MSLLGPAIGFGLVTASILALAAVGFTMQFGVTNILNLAYGEVMGAAGFIALLLNNRESASGCAWRSEECSARSPPTL